MSITELSMYACGHLAKLVLSYGLAAYLAQAIKEYFSDPKRGFIDDSMAGSCNGLQIPCPQCQKVQWDPLPWSEKQQQNTDRNDAAPTEIATKQDVPVDTIKSKESKESLVP